MNIIKRVLIKILSIGQIAVLRNIVHAIYFKKYPTKPVKTLLINLNAGPAASELQDIAKSILKGFKSNIIGAEFGVAYGGGY